MSSERRHFFTLMEVMIAAGILAMSVAATLAIVGGGRARLLRAEKRWGRAHLLSQVSEYYLLAGAEAEEPRDLLPDGFSASCELHEAEDLVEDASEAINGWVLGVYTIRVFDTKGGLLGEIAVEKLVREDDL